MRKQKKKKKKKNSGCFKLEQLSSFCKQFKRKDLVLYCLGGLNKTNSLHQNLKQLKLKVLKKRQVVAASKEFFVIQ